MHMHTYICEVPTAVPATVSGYVPYKTSSGDKRGIHLQQLHACKCISVCVYIRRAFSTHPYVHILIMGSSVYTSCTT